MSKMVIHNLTDVETPQLKQRGLVNAHIAVGIVMTEPGKSVEAGRDEMILSHLQHFIQIGALAVDDLPASYKVAKERMAPAPLPPPAPLPEPVKLEIMDVVAPEPKLELKTEFRKKDRK